MSAEPPLPAVPPELLAELDEDALAALGSGDPNVVAASILDLVDTLPPLTSFVRERSQWLAAARRAILGGVDPALGLDVRLLAATAHTAFAARQTVPAMTASGQAAAAAADIADLGLEIRVRARRLPHAVAAGNAEADAQYAALEALVVRAGEALKPDIAAEAALARVAWLGAKDRFDEVRAELVALARLPLPRDDRLAFIAYATHCALAQLSLRTRQRMRAVQALIEAARLAAELEAHAELANLQVVLAAYAVRIGDYDAARAHADSSLQAARAAGVQHAQPDPWLGMPFDVAPQDDCAGIIHVLAEAAVTALDRGDRTAFLVLATALVAFYLLADRAPEALDALHEALETARSGEDRAGVQMLRGVSEGLLRYIGMLS